MPAAANSFFLMPSPATPSSTSAAGISSRFCSSFPVHADVLPSPCIMQFDHSMENFNAESSSGFFTEAAKRWAKCADEHHFLLSIARIACGSFYRGMLAGSSTASEHAVDQEFGRAFLFVLFPDSYICAPRAELEKNFSRCSCGGRIAGCHSKTKK